MLGDNEEHIKLSRRKQKIIMNIRKRQPYPIEGDDESNSRQSRGQKRGRDDEYTPGYTGGKRPRYEKPSYDRNRDNRDNSYNAKKMRHM